MSDPAPPTASRRGSFRTMDPAKHREICAKGGRAAHAKGTAHQFDSDEARAAGRKGGIAVHQKRKAREAQGEQT